MLSPIESPIPPGIDPGILPVVRLMYANGIHTFQSCEGGVGHCTAEPFVQFRGTVAEAFHAATVVLNDPSHGLRPYELRQVWSLYDGWPDGPAWMLVFYPIDPTVLRTWTGTAATPPGPHTEETR